MTHHLSERCREMAASSGRSLDREKRNIGRTSVPAITAASATSARKTATSETAVDTLTTSHPLPRSPGGSEAPP